MHTKENYHYFKKLLFSDDSNAVATLREAFTKEAMQAMVVEGNFSLFKEAVLLNKLNVLNRLVELAPDQIPAMIHAQNFAAFRLAAERRYVDLLNRLVELEPDQVAMMIQAENFEAFRFAAVYLKYDAETEKMLDRLVSLAKEHHLTAEMIKVNEFEAFRKAAKQCNDELLKRLIELASTQDQLPAMLASPGERGRFDAFTQAVLQENADLLFRLIQLITTKQQFKNMIECAGGLALIINIAIRKNHIQLLNQLAEFTKKDELRLILEQNQSELLRLAAYQGHLEILNRLAELAPDSIQAMVTANQYAAFQEAASQGNLGILNRLAELAPDSIQAMIEEDRFNAFRSAARLGHPHILMRLMNLIAPDQAENMRKANHFEALRLATLHAKQEVVELLLGFPEQFDYAERHIDDGDPFHTYIIPFIQSTLESLRHEKEAWTRTHPGESFDVDEQKAKLCFYMMRCFIRTSQADHFEHLQFMLELPSVRALAHTDARGHHDNHLLRLAMRIGSEPAARILLAIPEVQALAQENDYYRDEQHRGMDLRSLAADPESSMRELTQGEQKRLDEVLKKYGSQTQNVNSVIALLKDTLKKRYEQHPAYLTHEGQRIRLPFDWNEFEALPNELKKEARKAYYQHPVHTAYRYLMKPNPWMSQDATFVQRSNQGAWSNFEHHKALISLCFLAAKDEDTPAIDGYTVATRLDGFIKELALIGRAHNWDKTRLNEHTQKNEEYDDLEGDKPSCIGGTKRRLFQSVQGHPLFKLLDDAIIQVELRKAIRAHFKECIQKATDRQALVNAWRRICEADASEDDHRLLSTLNLPEQKKAEFITSLEENYSQKLEPSLIDYIHQQFELSEYTPNHAEKLGGLADLSSILASEAPSSETVKYKDYTFDSNALGKNLFQYAKVRFETQKDKTYTNRFGLSFFGAAHSKDEKARALYLIQLYLSKDDPEQEIIQFFDKEKINKNQFYRMLKTIENARLHQALAQDLRDRHTSVKDLKNELTAYFNAQQHVIRAKSQG